jgi:glycosyltransferase involved in cell wall biosynthesis
MNLNKYSVIIPAYNAESTLRRTILSVMKQTFPPDKVVVVNDASTDNTSLILSEFNVEIVNNKANMGSGYSRNRALELIEDGIVANIDADDTWDVNYAERMMSLWFRAPTRTGAIGMLLRPEGILDKSGYLRQNSRLRERGFSRVSGLTLAWHNPFYASATSYDAAVIKDIGGWGPRPHSFSEDYSLLARIFDYDCSLFIDPTECGSYAISVGQKSAKIELQLAAEVAIIDFIANSKHFDQNRFVWILVPMIKFGAWGRSIFRLLSYNQREIPKLSILGERRILVLIDRGISKSFVSILLLIPFKIIRRFRHLALSGELDIC